MEFQTYCMYSRDSRFCNVLIMIFIFSNNKCFYFFWIRLGTLNFMVRYLKILRTITVFSYGFQSIFIFTYLNFNCNIYFLGAIWISLSVTCIFYELFRFLCIFLNFLNCTIDFTLEPLRPSKFRLVNFRRDSAKLKEKT